MDFEKTKKEILGKRFSLLNLEYEKIELIKLRDLLNEKINEGFNYVETEADLTSFGDIKDIELVFTKDLKE